MWKLLRNLLLAGVLAAGVVKLLAWYEVGQDAQRLSTALGPAAQLSYGSISAALNGNVTLSNVSVVFKRGAGAETFRADRVVFESPNVFWLLKHAFFAQDSWPAHFGIAVQGLKLPSTVHVDSHWFDPATFVPFQNAGCAATAFSAADFRKMEISPGETRQHGEFRYEAEGKSLDATLIFVAPETASITIAADLRSFEPKMLRSEEALRNLHVAQLSVQYDDPGFLKRRNAFCAQRAGSALPQFIEQHIAAVQEMLQQQGVEPSTEVLKLYRRLVENGGHASVLSLPSGSFAAGAWFTAAPEDILRQLNVTARYGDTPPVMFRLSFPAPAPSDSGGAVAETSNVPAAAPASPTVTAPTEVSSPAPAPPPSGVTAVQSATQPSAPSNNTPAPAVAVSTARSPRPETALPAPTPVAAASPSKPEPVATATRSSAPTGNGLEEFDRAAAKLAPPPPRLPSAPPAELLPSEAPPPPNSTLALVWKPTIERLPAAVAERPDYDVIDFAALKAHSGQFVRLVTEGGKKVEGYVVSADEAAVELRVNEGGGSVRFSIPKTRIQQIRLVRRGNPPA
jgi:hypothetical protein